LVGNRRKRNRLGVAFEGGILIKPQGRAREFDEPIVVP
jgi:hypothetical protein